MFINNKYSNTYYNIILRARLQQRKKGQGVYYELHHILPKSKHCWPEFKKCKWNQVLLTAKEHIICHLLLTKMLEGKQKAAMHFALKFTLIKTPFRKNKINNGILSFSKKLNAEAISIFNKGRVNSPAQRKFISEMRKKEKDLHLRFGDCSGSNNGMFGKHHSDKSKQKISKTKKERYKKVYWWNNGKISIMREFPPDDTFIKGRLKST